MPRTLILLSLQEMHAVVTCLLLVSGFGGWGMFF